MATRLAKLDWEALKERYGNRCAVCREREERVGGLEQAHVVARGKGGTQVVPMCGNDHGRYDKLKLEKWEVRDRIHLDWDKYVAGEYAPSRGKPSSSRVPKKRT